MSTFGSYAWDAPMKSFADFDASIDATSTDRAEPSVMTDLHRPLVAGDTDGGARASWLERHFEVASQIVTVAELVTSAVDAGLDSPAFVTLRRVSASFAVLRDRLYALGERAATEHGAIHVPSPVARYVDCVYWWVGQLLGDIEKALVEARTEDAEHRLTRAFEFSALYSLAHVAPLYDECAADAGSLATACARASADVSWLTWQLKDAIEG